MLCDAQVGQDVHTWERKNLNNQRFLRLQELSHKIQKIIRKTKTDVTYRFKQMKQKAKDEKIRSSKEF